jgi:muramidase (phage lysozyme)
MVSLPQKRILPPKPRLEDLPLPDQFQYHEKLEARVIRWRSVSLLAIFLLLSGIFVKPANDSLKWTYRFLGLPTTDASKLAVNKEYKPSDELNQSLKEGDIVSGFPVTSAYGNRDKPNEEASSEHRGVDIGVPTGTPLYIIGKPNPSSSFSGFAEVFCSLPMGDDARGFAAYVKSPDFPNVEFVYYHLKPYSCTSGRLDAGSKFAETGNSGNSTGPHLHFGTRLRGDWAKFDFREEHFEPKRWQVQWTLSGKEPSKEPVVATPNVKAFLGVIRHAEGTDHSEGYKAIFTGAKFDDFSKHPNTVKCSGEGEKKVCSAAAGAYQYMPDTWAWVSKEINAKDFSPENQERGAIALLKQRGVLSLIEEGKIEDALIGVCKEWASVSCDKEKVVGGLGKNQAVKPISELMEVYKKKKEGK